MLADLCVSERIFTGLRQLEPLLGGFAHLGDRFPSLPCCPASLHAGSELGASLWGEPALPLLRYGRLLGSFCWFGFLAAFLPLGGLGWRDNIGNRPFECLGDFGFNIGHGLDEILLLRGDVEQATQGVAGEVFDIHVGSRQQDGVVCNRKSGVHFFG